MKLHIGCGTTILDGWTNLDFQPGEGVDIVCDLDSEKIPLSADSVDEIYGSHVLEHLSYPLDVMQELWRVAKPDASMTLAVPYGSSDDAWEDATHVRPYFVGSWSAFGQPYHWRSNGYGYSADWRCDRIEIHLDRARYAGKGPDEALDDMMHRRNSVLQMVATLTAVKPARPAVREEFTPADLRFVLVDAE